MYDSFYVNLISPISRPRLETLAAAAVKGGSLNQVQKVKLLHLQIQKFFFAGSGPISQLHFSRRRFVRVEAIL